MKAANPATATVVYIDGLRVEPFYTALRKIMRDPQYQDFFLRNTTDSSSVDGFIPAVTYCAHATAVARVFYLGAVYSCS